MLDSPTSRCTLMARLRGVAITAGPVPVRIWEWSSAKTMSRIQCSRFSMCQCQRIASASWSARMGPVQVDDCVDGLGVPLAPALASGTGG
jgi:hypothetical protein